MKTKRIRKAVIPAAARILRFLAPVLYVHASQEREYRVALVFGV